MLLLRPVANLENIFRGSDVLNSLLGYYKNKFSIHPRNTIFVEEKTVYHNHKQTNKSR